MALILKTDGTKVEITATRADGTLSLKQMQQAVGGYIQLVNTANPDVILVVNEEGKLRDLPINEQATRIYFAAHGMSDVLVGDVLVCHTSEID